jgi:Rod binding domain-containing protein
MKIGNISKPSIPTTESKTPEEKLKEVAALYEKEFTRQLVKSMRATVPTGGLVAENQAEKIFSEELYNHYGDLMSDYGPKTLREHIYQNLIEKFGPQLGIGDKTLKPIGMLPLQIEKKEQVRIKQSGSDQIQYRFQWGDSLKFINEPYVQTPLGGKVSEISQFGENQGVSITLDHGKGLTSNLKFLGCPLVKLGDELNAGQHVASLDRIGRELIWSLQRQGLKASSE